MILAAGRGERMRPLSDRCPKPLLSVGGKALIEWQIERLVAAGFDRLVINCAHLGAMLQERLGNGDRYRAEIRYSMEAEPLEAAGGIATAMPLLGKGVVLVVSGDIYTDYDYATLHSRVASMSRHDGPEGDRAHLVMVPNPGYHAGGDFALNEGRLALSGAPRFTFGNIGLYRTSEFTELPRGRKLKILPLYERWIRSGRASGELYTGTWANVGTPDELSALDHEISGHSPPATPYSNQHATHESER
jgi:MurNAc alpha-1-phosphate uridylyltransferase